MNRQELLKQGYLRVERDDRLLDIFPKDTPAKGVELWERWDEQQVTIIRLWNGQQSTHTFPRRQIETALQENSELSLS